MVVASVLVAAACESTPPNDPSPDAAVPDSDTAVAFPRDLVGQTMLFGGAVTTLSDRTDVGLGALKMNRLEPIRVRPVAAFDNGNPRLELRCLSRCGDFSQRERLLVLPILGESADGQDLIVELAPAVERVNVDQLDYDVSFELLDTTVEPVGWDGDRLAFDTRSHIDFSRVDQPVEVVTRWFLKREASLVPDFEVRQNPGRDLFFVSRREEGEPINRLPTGAGPMHFYLMDVPEPFQAGFAAGFDDWNAAFKRIVGEPVFTYEFIAGGDIVPGDPAANVMVWDLDNVAPYGGSASWYASPRDGQTFAATVLIQGPRVVDFFSEWFAAADAGARATSPTARRAASERQRALARDLAAMRHVEPAVALSFAGRRLQPAQLDEYGPFFDAPPEGETFESYTYGYFRKLAAHELGHVLGLRHNFAGSLAEDGEGIASSSVMEYVRSVAMHLSRVGPYDEIAVRYGYLGEALPADLVFCTDADIAEENIFQSAECSKRDGGVDPFSFFRDERLRRALDLGIGRGEAGGLPVWGFADVEGGFETGYRGMLYYATSAAVHGSWRKFHQDPDRPTEPEAIRAYVVAEVASVLCDPSVPAHLEASYAVDAEAGRAAARTWDAMHDTVGQRMRNYGLGTGLPCEPRDMVSFDY